MEPLVTELAYWITKREEIRKLKESGAPKPWTDDPIFRTVRFTNVRREDDKVTKWIAANWRNPYWDHENLIPALVVARMVNKPETLAEIGFPKLWVPEQIAERIRLRAMRGEVTWGNAYMITTAGVSMAKEDYVVRVANDIHRRYQGLDLAGYLGNITLKEMHESLMQTKGLGSFLAAQIVADLKNTPGHPVSRAGGWSTWAASGPGSKKGLNYFYQLPPNTAMSEHRFLESIALAWRLVKPKLPKDLQDLHMQDFQNCFCEFSKYMRVQNGGRAKNGYPG